MTTITLGCRDDEWGRDEDGNEYIVQPGDGGEDYEWRDVVEAIGGPEEAVMATVEDLRTMQVENLFRALARRLPPHLLPWAERGWNS